MRCSATKLSPKRDHVRVTDLCFNPGTVAHGGAFGGQLNYSLGGRRSDAAYARDSRASTLQAFLDVLEVNSQELSCVDRSLDLRLVA